MIQVEAEKTEGILQKKFGEQGVAVESSGSPRYVMLKAVVEGTTLQDAKHFFEEALRNEGINPRRVSYMPQGTPSDNGVGQVHMSIE